MPCTLELAISNQQDALAVDEAALGRTVAFVLDQADCPRATVSLAVVDAATIRALQATYFDRDVDTDVISFDLRDGAAGDGLDCEVVVNAERARALGGDGPRATAELHLYVVHGLLHQLGYDDQDGAAAAAMHAREDELLDRLGFGRVFSGKG